MGFIKLKIVPSLAQTVFMAAEEWSRSLVLPTLINLFISVSEKKKFHKAIGINLFQNIIFVNFLQLFHYQNIADIYILQSESL